MTHAVSFSEGGVVTYANKWVRTERFLRAEREGFGVAPIGEANAGNPLPMMDMMYADSGDFGLMRGTANTAVAVHGGRLLALHEGDKPYELDPSTLETIGRFDFGGALEHRFTAHPKVCAVSGEMVTFGNNGMEGKPTMHISVVSPGGELTLRNFPVALRAAVVMHDVAITTRLTLVLEYPLFIRTDQAMLGKSTPWRVFVQPLLTLVKLRPLKSSAVFTGAPPAFDATRNAVLTFTIILNRQVAIRSRPRSTDPHRGATAAPEPR